MNYLISANTDAGKRKMRNQDSILIKKANFHGEALVLAVLCDGMGGLKKGEVASASVIQAFDRWFEKSMLSILLERSFEKTLFQSWEMLIQTMNQKLYQYGTGKNLCLGTTLTAMLFWKKRYYAVHVGDSRAYELREELVQLTKDQTLIQREIDQGRLKKEAARKDSRRNILLQCIGASKRVKPDYFTGVLRKESVYLLCCDGFCRLLEEEELYEAFEPKKAVSESVMERTGAQLVQLVKERGECDNISVIAVCVRR